MDKNNFAKLIDKYSDSLYRCAFSYCNNTQDAEDIVQEVFMKYLRKKPSFSNEEHEKAWFIRVTINLCKDLQKTYWKKNVQELKDDIEEYSDNDKLIYYLIAQLPPKYKIVIQLHYQEGYKIKEISNILNKKESTIGSRLSRAKEILKQKYEEAINE